MRDIIDRGEEVVSVFVEELTGSTSLREELEKTLRRANRARKTVDRNVEAVMGALNLPTRRDYTKLLDEIHSLQGAITNLNMKMDRLIATATRSAESAMPKPLIKSDPATSSPEGTAGGGVPIAARRLPAGKRRATKSKKRAARKRIARD